MIESAATVTITTQRKTACSESLTGSVEPRPQPPRLPIHDPLSERVRQVALPRPSKLGQRATTLGPLLWVAVARSRCSPPITTSFPVTPRRLATSRGSFPSAATLDKTSAQFTTLTTAPSAIASTTAEEPCSSCSNAITAEASSTHAGARDASASGTVAAGFVLAVFRSSFGSPLSDQLVAERSARVAAEHPPRTLGSGPTPLYLRLGELGGLRHVAMVPPMGADQPNLRSRCLTCPYRM